MRAVMIEAPEDLLAERRRLGLDGRDELWEGVLHMVPPAASAHMLLSSELHLVLAPLAAQRGLKFLFETGLFAPGNANYRVPDLMAAAPEHISERGIEGKAALVIEILSPNDESREKMTFYASQGVPEVWLLEPKTRAVEVFVLRGEAYYAVAADPSGALHAPALGLTLLQVDGPKLRIVWDGGRADV
jgi:Uma2 family endonuclease